MRFIEDDIQSSNDLPWINEYINGEGKPGDISRVESIKPTVKGLLILCKDFKGFIFSGSRTHNFLSDATTYWRKFPVPGYALYAKALESGKITIAVEESEDGIFTVSKKGEVEIKIKKDSTQSTQENLNPFIPPDLPVPTTSKRRRASEDDTDGAETKR